MVNIDLNHKIYNNRLILNSIIMNHSQKNQIEIYNSINKNQKKLYMIFYDKKN